MGMFSGSPRTLDEANYETVANRSPQVPLRMPMQTDSIIMPSSNLTESPEQSFMQDVSAPRDVVFRNNSRTVQTPEEAAIQNAKRNYIARQPEYAPDIPKNVLAPYGTALDKSFSPKMPPQAETPQNVNRPPAGDVSLVTTTPSTTKGESSTKGIFDSISNTFKDISKSASDTFKSDSFREGLGGMFVALGAGFQGQDASKALERYNNSLLNDKEEARRKILEEEKRQKNNAASTWNLTYREMFKKYVPGVDKLMGDAFNNMTEEMLKSSYPMISDGIKKMTERELSDPNSMSSKDSVSSYNEMISSFGGAVKPLEVGKYSAKQVEDMKGNLNNVLRFYDSERDREEKVLTREQQATQNSLDRMARKEWEQGKLNLDERKLKQDISEGNRRAALEREKFNYQKKQDAERNKLIKERMQVQQSASGGVLDKEQRRLLEKYPSGIVLKDVEARKLQDKQNGYTKMKSALDVLEGLMNKYGAPMSPTSNGYAEINSAWSQYVAAIKEAEELGALDGGVSKLANETLPNPTKINPLVRVTGGSSAVQKNTLDILKTMRNQYKYQYAKNTAAYGFNPELSADDNTRYMDEYTNPNTPPERQDQIYESIYKNLGYDAKMFRLYTGNYVKRRYLFTGVK